MSLRAAPVRDFCLHPVASLASRRDMWGPGPDMSVADVSRVGMNVR
jgi:hypothetical protein